jgi:glycosyltransferase involved in cell wall biosynthesis
MKLLITTQAVDTQDPILGFFHRWLVEFAKHVESVEVICLYEGAHELPDNVVVHSLGKEKVSKKRKTHSSLYYGLKFLWLACKLRKKYDEVFVHMNPEYVVLGGVWWKLWKKRVGLWYLHKSVDLKLRTAEIFADVIFTASAESFRLKSKKVRIVGHGIDTALFSPAVPAHMNEAEKETVKLVTVGRITRAKNLHVLQDAARLIGEGGMRVSFDIIGAPVHMQDVAYEDELTKQAGNFPGTVHVREIGAKTQTEVAKFLSEYTFFIHASTGTGSIDKAVLEALSAGVPVISTSEAFKDLLSPYGLYVTDGSAEGIAATVMQFLSRSDAEKSAVTTALRDQMVAAYSLSALIPRILRLLAGTVQ